VNGEDVCLPRRDGVSGAKSYQEIIDFIAAGTIPEAVVAFRPFESVRQGVAELVKRSRVSQALQS
jgi:hypothetical protein